MQYGQTQELTLVTREGVFHQAGISHMGPATWCPQLAEKAKPSAEYAPVFYTRLVSPPGGAEECLNELIEQANLRITSKGNDPIVGLVIHTSKTEHPGVAEYLTEAQIKKLVGPLIDVSVKLD